MQKEEKRTKLHCHHRNVKKSLHTQFNLRFKPLFPSVLGSLELDRWFSDINIGKEKNPKTPTTFCCTRPRYTHWF